MSDSKIKFEVHLIQNFAPSNLNRDDTGQPKSAYFGGCRRARISSQCWKQAVRKWWREHGTVTLGDRTKRLQQMIAEKLSQDQEFTMKIVDKKDRNDGIRIFTDAYYATADKKDPDKTNVLIFISQDEVDICARAIKECWNDKNEKTIRGISSIIREIRDYDAKNASKKKGNAVTEQLKSDQDGDEDIVVEASDKKKPKKPTLKTQKEIEDQIKKAKVSADIALFGRMLAEQPGRNTDGACQVAHPISTHKVDMEMDYFTALDDMIPEEQTGAEMIGTIGFNSACYYRYALLDRDQLARNLARKTECQNGKWSQELNAKDYQEADIVIKAFLKAIVYAIPSGKQNSFGAQNLPSFGMFVSRQGGVPISLANAFSTPIRPTKDNNDLVGLSVAALTKHWDMIKNTYGNQGVKATTCFQIDQEDNLNGLSGSDKESVEKAIDAILEAL